VSVRVAACQIDPKIGEVEQNLERIERALVEAGGMGAALVVLPEAAVTGYAFDSIDDALVVARHANAVAPDRLAELAQQHAMTVICGSLEAIGDAVRNVAHVMAPDGRRFKYCKTHLPFLGVDRFATPGEDAPTVYEIDGLRVGVLICYDLRFPEAARVCGLEGADLIALPTNWPVGVEFHPDLFAPARAAENHCYLVAADRVGTEGGTTFIGRSLLVDYDGGRMATASDTSEETNVGEIDPEAARQTHVRRRPGEHEWDTIADRRPGLYGRLMDPGADRLYPPSAHLFSGDVFAEDVE
jgi:predicted amidohydrolase